MTDIQRHVPAVAKALGARLQALADGGVAELTAEHRGTLASAIRALLPGSYGVGAGTVVGVDGGESQPVDLVIYDRTLARETVYGAYDRYGVGHVLAAFHLRLDHDYASLNRTLDAISSVKALTLRPGAPAADDGAAPAKTRRGRYPLAIALFWRWGAGSSGEDLSTEDLALLLHRALAERSEPCRPDEVRALRHGLVYRRPETGAGCLSPDDTGLTRLPELVRPRSCYVCKADFCRRHFFYESLCPRCGDLNYARRVATADLGGRVALVTGARTGIGHAVALKLLRAGAVVVATTRFPHDAARRFAREQDCADWIGRLRICGLDLRYVPGVEAFADGLGAAYARLDILVNNAAQTVRRPPSFYTELLPFESRPRAELPLLVQALLAPEEEWPEIGYPMDRPSASPWRPRELDPPTRDPPGALPRRDGDGQSSSASALSGGNSWTAQLEDLSAVELLEVQIVNNVAPALLLGRLKWLLARAAAPGAHVVNVAAAEGQFAQSKRGAHPHTNMAKAALNMLTHTVAGEYARDRIFVTSVDPGWVSYQASERAGQEGQEGQEGQSSRPQLPLDLVDAAARVCDPIFAGLTTRQSRYGVLLKDYAEAAW